MNMFLINLEDYSNCIFVSSYIVSQSPWPILPRWTGPLSMCLYRKKRDNAVASVSASHCERWKLCFSTEKLPITLPSKRGTHFKSYKLRGKLSWKGFIEEQLNTFQSAVHPGRLNSLLQPQTIVILRSESNVRDKTTSWISEKRWKQNAVPHRRLQVLRYFVIKVSWPTFSDVLSYYNKFAKGMEVGWCQLFLLLLVGNLSLE